MIRPRQNARFAAALLWVAVSFFPVGVSAEPLPLACDLASGGASASAFAMDSAGGEFYGDGFPDCLSAGWWNGAGADLVDGASSISGSAEVLQGDVTSLTLRNEFAAVFVGDYSAQVTAGADAHIAFDVPELPSPVEAELIFVRTRTGAIEGSFGGSLDGPGIDLSFSALLNGEPLGELRIPVELEGGATYRMFVASDAALMTPGTGLQELSATVSVPEATQSLQGAVGALVLAAAALARRRSGAGSRGPGLGALPRRRGSEIR